MSWRNSFIRLDKRSSFQSQRKSTSQAQLESWNYNPVDKGREGASLGTARNRESNAIFSSIDAPDGCVGPSPERVMITIPAKAVTTTLPSIGLQCRTHNGNSSCICPIRRNQGRKQLCLATGTNRSRHVEPPRLGMLDLACTDDCETIDEQLLRLT